MTKTPATPPPAAATKAEAPPATNLTFRSQQLSSRKPTRFAFRPDAAGRRALADALGLLDLHILTFEGELRPTGRADFTLEAHLSAKAVQPCSVTLAPVPARIDTTVRRHYEADFQAPDAEEAEMVDEETDPLPEVFDIAAIAAEALSLALPLYPRAPGAELGEAVFAAPGVAPLVETDLKPFAGLADLAQRLKKSDSDPSSKD